MEKGQTEKLEGVTKMQKKRKKKREEKKEE